MPRAGRGEMNLPDVYRSAVRDAVFGARGRIAVGNRSRIQSQSMICELVEICGECFIGHGGTFIADMFESAGSEWSYVGQRESGPCFQRLEGRGYPGEDRNDTVIASTASNRNSKWRVYTVGNPATFLRKVEGCQVTLEVWSWDQ